MVCSDKSFCQVLVLHSGQRLTVCPLGINDHDPQLAEESGIPGADVVRPVDDWRIGDAWTTSRARPHSRHETIESVGMNAECQAEQVSQRGLNDAAFSPAEVGCVMVGTSSGRIVALRQHAVKEEQLVPEWATQQRRRAVAQGTIHVFNGGFVAILRPEIGVLQVSQEGNVLMQWRLPDSANWIALGGGGDSLYILGSARDNGEDSTSLWQFPLPSELRGLLASHREMRRRIR